MKNRRTQHQARRAPRLESIWSERIDFMPTSYLGEETLSEATETVLDDVFDEICLGAVRSHAHSGNTR